MTSASAIATAATSGCSADDNIDELNERVPMLYLYYDNDEAHREQQTNDYSTNGTCVSHSVC